MLCLYKHLKNIFLEYFKEPSRFFENGAQYTHSLQFRKYIGANFYAEVSIVLKEYRLKKKQHHAQSVSYYLLLLCGLLFMPLGNRNDLYSYGYKARSFLLWKN